MTYDEVHAKKNIGSLVQGKTVSMESGRDTTVKGSAILGEGDVTIQAGGNAHITASEDTVQELHQKEVKKSGLLGGGLGFTIGKEQKKDRYDEDNTIQKGSVIGSAKGDVRITAKDDIRTEASAISAGRNAVVEGKNVTITSKGNVYSSAESHEYKKSGLSVSLGGGAVDVLGEAAGQVHRGSQVRDNQLKLLYGAEAYQTLAKNKDVLTDLKGKGMPGISVGISSSSYKGSSQMKVTEAAGSTIVAGQDAAIRSTENIQSKGSAVTGKNVTLTAGKNIQMEAAENISSSSASESSKQGSLGVTFSPSGNGVYGNKSQGKGYETERVITHTGSSVAAGNELHMESGKDIAIRGSQAGGEKVEVHAGGNLSIESVQDREEYGAENHGQGSGFGISTSGSYAGRGEIGTGTSKGQTHSTYSSVASQAGIYAGSEGYDVEVKGNTDLKGSVIDSKAPAEKNPLTTGTLTWDEIDNEASYKVHQEGQNASVGMAEGSIKAGTAPVRTQDVKGHAGSTAKAGIAEGTITITDKKKQKQDIAKLNRDTKDSLGKLARIFDKEEVKEKQEMVNAFEHLASEKIGDLAAEKGWVKDDPRRALLHGLAGTLASGKAGGSALSGGAGAFTMEAMQPILDTFLKEHPDLREEASVLIGGTVGKLLGGDSAAGEAAAWSGTKYNWLTHEQYEKYKQEMKSAKTAAEKDQVEEKWNKRDKEQGEAWVKEQTSGMYYNPFGNYGDYESEYHVNVKKDIIPIFTQDALAGALDYKAEKVTKHATPVGTLMSTINTIMSDSDVNAYGYIGVKRRLFIDVVTTTATLYAFRNMGLYYGIGASTASDFMIDNIKNLSAPNLTPEEVAQKNEEYMEHLIKD